MMMAGFPHSPFIESPHNDLNKGMTRRSEEDRSKTRVGPGRGHFVGGSRGS